ncbi:putative phosphoglycerate mutase pmu1 [Exophiala xenobiotica]|nr:putative phosphoglycerate mutase pmu1 [Exophiala xenobiotica]
MSETGSSLIKSSSPSEASTAETKNEVERSQEWHYNYSTVVGFLSQDLARPVSGRLDATEEDFELMEQKYDTDKLLPDKGKLLNQWQRFAYKLKVMNQRAPKGVTYRLLYLGRHGQGYHNVGIMFYGDAAWDCYYGAFDRDPNVPSITYLDAHLTPLGKHQAKTVSTFWQNLISTQKMPLPQTYYSSPLTRAMQTAQLTFSGLPLPPSQTFRPVVKEFLREAYGIQSCDLRPTKSYIKTNFPDFRIEDSFTENDELHSPTRRESLRRHDRRVRALLDDVFAHDESTYISMTSHCGTIKAMLRVVGHIALSLPPGGIVPVLVKVSEVSGKRHDEEDNQGWDTKPACESDPLKAGRDGYKDVAEFLDEINRGVPELAGMLASPA